MMMNYCYAAWRHVSEQFVLHSTTHVRWPPRHLKCARAGIGTGEHTTTQFYWLFIVDTAAEVMGSRVCAVVIAVFGTITKCKLNMCSTPLSDALTYSPGFGLVSHVRLHSMSIGILITTSVMFRSIRKMIELWIWSGRGWWERVM